MTETPEQREARLAYNREYKKRPEARARIRQLANKRYHDKKLANMTEMERMIYDAREKSRADKTLAAKQKQAKKLKDAQRYTAQKATQEPKPMGRPKSTPTTPSSGSIDIEHRKYTADEARWIQEHLARRSA